MTAVPLDFDPARLEAHLRGRIPGFAGPLRVERVAGGQSNPTFFVESDTHRLVLRKQPPGPLLPRCHNMRALFLLFMEGTQVDRGRPILRDNGFAVPQDEAVQACGPAARA